MLKIAGSPIGAYDVLIAATALSHNYIIVKSNVREFQRVPNLQIENWRVFKYFPKESLIPWGVEAYHPDDFLVKLYEKFPEKMVQVISQQSADLQNPPITINQLLEKLKTKNRVLKFVDCIYRHLEKT